MGLRQIRAVVVEADGNAALREIGLDDTLRPHDVLVRPLATGICMSDVKLMLAPDGYYPTVLGHELLGVVEGVGEAVIRCAPGDTVVATVAPVCGQCRFCKAGHGNLCLSGGSVVSGHQPNGEFRLFGGNGAPVGQYCFLGTLADLIVTTENQLMSISASYQTKPAVAMLSCSLSTAAGAVYEQQPYLLTASSVAVVGAGGLGSCTLMALKSIEVGNITVIDPDPSRLARAKKLGADIAVTLEETSALARFDVVFEASMYGAGLPLALHLTERGGRCVTMGMPPYGTRLDNFDHWGLVSEQRTLVGTVTTTASPWDTYIRILSAHEIGCLPFTELVDKYYAGLDAAIEAIRDAREHRVGKAVVLHNG